jgi:prolyl-tRNA synthetase
MGALIMAHSDDNGLVIPPKLAPTQVVIIPIYRTDDQLTAINEKVNEIVSNLKAKGISVKYDNRDTYKPGWKFNEYEFKGVPVRLAIGPRDLENGTVEVSRRDTLEKATYQLADIENKIEHLLQSIQENLYQKALDFRERMTTKADTWEEFTDLLDNKGGFILAHWDGTPETEQEIKEKTKATIRLIPFDSQPEEGQCILTGKPSSRRVVFARAY